MIGSNAAEVLIVGAGPVGILTALCLAEAGVRVCIIDCAQRSSTRSYACALHRRTLDLLERFGLAGEVLKRGRRLNCVGFYDHSTCLGEVQPAAESNGFPLEVVLPQGDLEKLLEQRLIQRYGVAVQWNHRLRRIDQDANSVAATVDEIAGTAGPQVTPHWELVVKQTQSRHAFVVGSDGRDSQVRHGAGIAYRQVGRPEAFSVFDLVLDRELEPAQRVVLGDAASSFLWPYSGKACRWSFQMHLASNTERFPQKDRRLVRSHDEGLSCMTRAQVQTLISTRAPWFTAKVQRVSWSVMVNFERRLATEFGRGRCWLAGDAAHQTSPAGMQSMNVGLCEAANLADTLTDILRRNAPLGQLQTYDQQRQREWQLLLGLRGKLRPIEPGASWTKEHCWRLLPCLPTSADSAGELLKSIGLEWMV